MVSKVTRSLIRELTIITQVITEIHACYLIKIAVIFRYFHLQLTFKMAASRFVNVSEEINIK